MLNKGSSSFIKSNDIIREINVITTDSVINCPISMFLFAPTIFLIPDSFDLLADLAVARFIVVNGCDDKDQYGNKGKDINELYVSPGRSYPRSDE
jgi:hypothetical protein